MIVGAQGLILALICPVSITWPIFKIFNEIIVAQEIETYQRHIFGTHFWAWCHTGAEGSGTLKTPEILAHWVSLMAPSICWNQVFKKFRADPP